MAQAEWRPLVWLEAVIGPYCLASNHDTAMHFKYCVWVGCTSMIIIILTRPKPDYGRQSLAGGIVGPG